MDKKAKIEFGNVEVSEEVLERKNQKIRISIMIDGDLLDAFKAAAAKQNKGYQTLMQEKLREAMDGNRPDHEERISYLERELRSLVWAEIRKEKRIGRDSVAHRAQRKGARGSIGASPLKKPGESMGVARKGRGGISK